MEGCLFAILYVTLWYIPKALLEAKYFKDRVDAKKSLFLWLVSVVSIGIDLCATLFIDHFG